MANTNALEKFRQMIRDEIAGGAHPEDVESWRHELAVAEAGGRSMVDDYEPERPRLKIDEERSQTRSRYSLAQSWPRSRPAGPRTKSPSTAPKLWPMITRAWSGSRASFLTSRLLTKRRYQWRRNHHSRSSAKMVTPS